MRFSIEKDITALEVDISYLMQPSYHLPMIVDLEFKNTNSCNNNVEYRIVWLLQGRQLLRSIVERLRNPHPAVLQV